MLGRLKFVAAHEAGYLGFYSDYRRLIANQRRPLGQLKAEQELALRRMVRYAYENVPYYHQLFRTLKLEPGAIRTIGDLERLPILKKETIKQHFADFVPACIRRIPHHEETTGGSMGTPMKYLVSRRDRLFSGAMLYRGWGYGGYELGDRMVFLAGLSLDFVTKKKLSKAFHEFARNIRKLSTLNMDQKEMQRYAEVINHYRPRFIRGYASSIYIFTQWIRDNDVKVHQPKNMFTTSEKLYPKMRETIAKAFNCDVLDGYGLMDGGVTAFECPEHAGLHVDMERSVVEIVSSEGHAIEEGRGSIVATSLENYAMPLLRYDTNDVGHIVSDPCPCGRPYRLLKEICGRSGDFLYTPEGKAVHSLLFAYIFDELPWVRAYQVVQERLDHITVKIIPDRGFDQRKLDDARLLIRRQSDGWQIDFDIVDRIEKTRAGKYKYIVNNIDNKN